MSSGSVDGYVIKVTYHHEKLGAVRSQRNQRYKINRAATRCYLSKGIFGRFCISYILIFCNASDEPYR